MSVNSPEAQAEGGGRNIVLMTDGTGNEPRLKGESNVLRLYKMLIQDDRQLVWYDPGVGTEGDPRAITDVGKKITKTAGLVVGYGLKQNVMDGYTYLMNNPPKSRRQPEPATSIHPNAAKTHCPKGHPYSGDNLYIDPKGYRRCLECRQRWPERPAKATRKRARKVAVHPNAAKTHCPKGHSYDGDNLYVDPKGNRRCRECKRLGRRAEGVHGPKQEVVSR